MYKLLLSTVLLVSACNGEDLSSRENPILAGDCTLTQGYWKNHPAAWPVNSLELGQRTYSKAEALSILGRPVQGNGLLSLSHQLIASKLNVVSGATNAVASAIADADALIGSKVVPPVGTDSVSTASTASLVQALDDYNTGKTGPGHCDGVGKPECICGDGAIDAPEQCDDGNTVDGDGCSSSCRIEGLQ